MKNRGILRDLSNAENLPASDGSPEAKNWKLSLMLFFCTVALFMSVNGWADGVKVLKKVSTYNATGSLQNYSICEYDQNNRVIKSSHYNIQYPSSNGYVLYTYTTDGKEDEIRLYLSSGQLQWWSKNQWNYDGTLYKKSHYDSSSTLTSYSIYEYDASKKVIRVNSYDRSGSFSSYITYTYDSRGNEVEMKFYYYSSGSFKLGSYIKNEYDTDNMKTKQSAYAPDGTLQSYTIFEYTTVDTTCSFTIYPETKTISSSGGTFSVSVAASVNTCGWTAISNALWIMITSGSNGSGNGTVSYSVAANTGTSTRTGTMTIAGRTFTVTQSGASAQHTLTVTKSGTGTVTSNPAGINCGTDCTETYNSSASVTLTAAPATGSTFAGWSGGGCSGTGTCTVTMDAAKTVTATFTQTPVSCTYSISPTSKAFTASGGTDSVSVTTQSNCNWTAKSNAAWIKITFGNSGVGNGAVNYSVSANPSARQRTGTMTIAGQTFTVTQEGKPIISASPMAVNFGPVRVGDTSTRIVTVKNTGGSDLEIYSINISGANASEFDKTTCSIITAGSSCDVTVTFRPTIPFGKKTAIMSISSNDPKKRTVNVKLMGNAPCLNIEGNWAYEIEGAISCTFRGRTVSEPFSDSGTVSIYQNGCNITIDDEIKGKVKQDKIAVSGVLRETIDGVDINFKYAAKGIINDADTINWNGSGKITGIYEGIRFSCKETDTTVFTRVTSSESALIQTSTGARATEKSSLPFMNNVLKSFKEVLP